MEKPVTGRYESFELSVAPEDLIPTVERLESEGAFGLTLRWRPSEVGIRAWKGKEGPCHETGRSATYRGPALAVGDDDNHFIGGTVRVCEKTASIYASEAYREHLEVTPPEADLQARLEADPVPFDCDTLADDAAGIAERIEPGEEPREESVVYLGPFRYVVLSNGTVLRRGLPAQISRAHARQLAAVDYVAELDVASPPAADFRELYRRYGPLFLVGRGAGRSPVRLPDCSALEGTSAAVRQRLAKMIARGDEYFMLQGTDPAVGGCCPLPQVGECNRLVEAGLLDAWQSPLSPECPVTAYAVAGELGPVRDGMPTYYRNELLRRTVAARLGAGP